MIYFRLTNVYNMKGFEAIPSFLYIIAALVVGVVMLLMIGKYSHVFIPEEKNITIGGNEEKAAKSLAGIIEKCWEDHRSGLDDKSDVCKEINIEGGLKIDEKSLNKFLDCRNLPNTGCYGFDCSGCSSDYFDDTDRIIWMAEPDNKRVKINYDGSSRKIVVVGYPCDDMCVCKRNCIEKYIFGASGHDACIADCESLFECGSAWGSCTKTDLDFDNSICRASLDCNLCSFGTPSLTSHASLDSDWCKYCALTSEKGFCNDGIDNDCDGLIDSKSKNPVNPDDGYNDCGGPAFLHGDMWPWWHNFRVQCDPEYKALWLCEKKNSLGLEINSCDAQRTQANNCDLSGAPNWGVCCPDRVSCQSHRGDDICDATSFDYDSLFNQYYGWQWGAHTDWHRRNILEIRQDGNVIARFTEASDQPYQGTGKGYIMKINDLNNPFGAFGCIEIPTGVVLEVYAEWMNPTFPHTCPGAAGLGCSKTTTFIAESGKHYIWEYTGQIRELPNDDIPPEIKQRLNNAGIPLQSCYDS